MVRHGVACTTVASVQEAAELMLLLRAGCQASDGLALPADGAADGVICRAELAGRAQQLLGAAAELVALLGGRTLADGLRALRDRGRPVPAGLERSARALDAAGALLRHPREAERSLDGLRARLRDARATGADDTLLGGEGWGLGACLNCLGWVG